jgi:hypothetical protein
MSDLQCVCRRVLGAQAERFRQAADLFYGQQKPHDDYDIEIAEDAIVQLAPSGDAWVQGWMRISRADFSGIDFDEQEGQEGNQEE